MSILSIIMGISVWLGCGGENSTVQVNPGQILDGRAVMADALIYDNTSGRSFAPGEDIPFTGVVEWYYGNGKLHQQTSFADGREHGSSIWWHEDGARAGHATYLNGVLNGPLVQWYPDGVTKELHATYRMGKQEGQEIWWHPNRKEKGVTSFINGKREGAAYGWFLDGTKSWQAAWKNDKAHGWHVEWYPSGMTNSLQGYVQGQRVGLEAWWFESGQISRAVNWQAGRRQGLLIQWYENGNKMSQTPYVNDVRHGSGEGWYEKGAKAYEAEYRYNEEVDIKEWKEDGKEVAIPETEGRKRPWQAGEFKNFYKGKSRDSVVWYAFGEPDHSGENTWRFDMILVDGLRQSVLFTFENNLVKDVSIGVGTGGDTP
jgi:antitoxin component YwqK of YwqJK toxin-antitoxin module